MACWFKAHMGDQTGFLRVGPPTEKFVNRYALAHRQVSPGDRLGKSVSGRNGRKQGRQRGRLQSDLNSVVCFEESFGDVKFDEALRTTRE